MSKDVYHRALLVQDACNASGVLLAFARDLDAIQKNANERGERLCDNPAFIAYVGKLASLCGIQDIGNEKELKAYSACADRS